MSEIQKEIWLQEMHQIIDQRIEQYRNDITSAEESRNTATKSSAGDKHETGRALMQIELNNLEKQLSTNLALKNSLNHLPISENLETIAFGNLIKTDQGMFFISVSLGKITFGAESCYALSPAAPLGIAFIGHKKGDKVGFREKTYLIENIY